MRDVQKAFAGLPDRLLVGFSGGADSTALMRLLLRERGRKGLTAAHVHHGLRGADADADEAFVRECCEAWGVPLHVRRLTPPPHPSEDWARGERMRFFRELLLLCGADALVLAHQMDDQAETVLLHMLRGCGLRGLAGIQQDTVLDGMRVIRPLIAVASHRELCRWLESIGQNWREDGTNREETFLRNRVRCELLPLMETLSPGVTLRLCGMAERLGADEAALERLTERLLREADLYGALRLPNLLEGEETAARRALRTWWQRKRGGEADERSLSHDATERIFRLAAEGHPGDSITVPGGLQVYRGWHALHLLSGEDPSGDVPLEADGAALNGVRLTLSAPAAGSPGLPENWLSECRLRTRRPGDTVRTGDGLHHRSLQDFLVDSRVDAPWRAALPLLCRGSEVLAIPGLYAGGLQEGGMRVAWTVDGRPVQAG